MSWYRATAPLDYYRKQICRFTTHEGNFDKAHPPHNTTAEILINYYSIKFRPTLNDYIRRIILCSILLIYSHGESKSFTQRHLSHLNTDEVLCELSPLCFRKDEYERFYHLFDRLLQSHHFQIFDHHAVFIVSDPPPLLLIFHFIRDSPNPLRN